MEIPFNKFTDNEIRSRLNSDSFDFLCQKCGNCCRGTGEVFFSKNDILNIREYLNWSDRDYHQQIKNFIQSSLNGYFVHFSSGSCYFLKGKNRCRIYDVRPVQCRTYPFWHSNFNSREDVLQLKEECSGSLKGDGEKYSIKETIQNIHNTAEKFLLPQKSESDSFLL